MRRTAAPSTLALCAKFNLHLPESILEFREYSQWIIVGVLFVDYVLFVQLNVLLFFKENLTR